MDAFGAFPDPIRIRTERQGHVLDRWQLLQLLVDHTDRSELRLLIRRNQRRHLDHLSDFGHGFIAILQDQGFFARMGNAHGVPGHARAAVNELVFPGHGVEIARLQVQKIVIVGEPRSERPASEEQHRADGEHEPRPIGECGQPDRGKGKNLTSGEC